MTVTIREHLEGTISHLSVKKRYHLAEINRLDEVLKALYAEIDVLPRTELILFPPNEGEYAGISIRWAILSFFSASMDGKQTLGSIADALRAGGATTKGQSFNSNVSAVLSVMVAKGEMEKTDEGFSLTEHGRVVWHSIRTSDRFLNRKAGDTAESEA